MEVNQDKKVELEEGGGDAGVGGRMEAGGQREREVNVEAGAVDPIISSRKSEPLYKTHEMQFLAIGPEEIWKVILGKLKEDPDAQTRCANASPYFWELLKHDRVLFLFPKVVEVVAPKASNRDFGMYLEAAVVGRDFKEEEDYFWTREEGKDWRVSVLECRLVCSAWNKAVEQCYEGFVMAGQAELLAENDMDPRSPVKRLGMPWTLGHYRFDSFRSIQHFLNEFEGLHFSNPEVGGPPKNPFFGRWIFIDVTMDQDYSKGLSQLLELFGKEVWYCVITWLSPTTAKELSSELVKWLGLMPNLKVLGLQGPESVEGLSRKDFQVNRIPKLEKLEILELARISGLISSEVMRVNCHAKVLRMTEIISGVDLEVGRLQENLKSFTPIGSKPGHKMLNEFGHHWKQLSRLYLEYGSKYFGKLETNWAQTLTELELIDPFGMKKVSVLNKSKNLSLKLPRIRRLSLQITGLFYLDFIKPMQGSLEHLELVGIEFRDGFTLWDRNKVKKEQSIELVGFEEKMHKSNVWNSFGKLETIKVVSCRKHMEEFHIFSKEGKKYLCTSENEDVEEPEPVRAGDRFMVDGEEYVMVPIVPFQVLRR